jgi:hypothetical protein
MGSNPVRATSDSKGRPLIGAAFLCPRMVPLEPIDGIYSYLNASPGFMFAARLRGKKITISVPTIAKTSDQPT